MTTATATKTTSDHLRDLATFLDSNPDIASHAMVDGVKLMQYVGYGVEDKPAYLASAVRSGLAAGAKVAKSYDDRYANVILTFGPIEVEFYTKREEVCERVVRGTKEVTKEVPDPEALAAVPKVTVTETVEDVEWVCSPLLA